VAPPLLEPGRSIHLLSPAKINLALAVAQPITEGPGAGMHPIASWMTTLAFCDDLHITRPEMDGRDVAFSREPADDAPRSFAIDWPLEKDLAYRAWRLMEQQLGRPVPWNVRLRKRIPPGAGLGGGSANAGTVLIALDRLLALDLPQARLVEMAASLGSDVAFFVAALRGAPACLVTGLGEQLEPLPLPRPVHLALILPDFGCPTGAVYRAFDDALDSEPDTPRPAADVARIRQLASALHLPAAAPFNDLQVPALTVEPRLAALKGEVDRLLGRPSFVTGSGSTLVAIADDAPAARNAAARLRDQLGVAAVATRTV